MIPTPSGDGASPEMPVAAEVMRILVMNAVDDARRDGIEYASAIGANLREAIRIARFMFQKITEA